MEAGRQATSIGTPLYIAPEMIESDHAVTFASDIWAVGCILYEMCELKHPFYPDGCGTLVQGLRKARALPQRGHPLMFACNNARAQAPAIPHTRCNAHAAPWRLCGMHNSAAHARSVCPWP